MNAPAPNNPTPAAMTKETPAPALATPAPMASDAASDDGSATDAESTDIYVVAASRSMPSNVLAPSWIVFPSLPINPELKHTEMKMETARNIIRMQAVETWIEWHNNEACLAAS